MKQKPFIILTACLSAGAVAAGGHGAASGGFGCFGPTLNLIDFEGLNEAINPYYGTNRLSETHWAFGGAGYAFVNRIVLGSAGWGGAQNVSLKSDSLLCRVSFSGGQFEAGYTLLDLKHILVTPLVGIGGTTYDIELQPLSGTVPNFDSLLAYPGRTSSASAASFSLLPELMITIPISFVGLQVKAGYCFTPGSPEWKLKDGARLVKGPRLAQGVPFISLNVVFGGLGRNQKPRVKLDAEAKPKPGLEAGQEEKN